MDERKVTISFLVVTCKRVLSGILGRSFLERLDVVASPFHLKVAYHISEGKPIVISSNLKEA